MRLAFLIFLLCDLSVWGLEADTTESASVLTVVGHLKSLREGSIEVFETTSKALNDRGDAEGAAKVDRWSNEWLSVLGISSGLTGLAKDFTLNYLGRSAYHDNNGNLIEALRMVTTSFPSKAQPIDENLSQKIQKRILAVCKEGKKVFKKDGALYTMLEDLDALLVMPSVAKELSSSLASIQGARGAFDYFSGATAGIVSRDEL